MDNVHKSTRRDIIGDFYDVSGPHCYQQVAVHTIFSKKIFNLIKRVESVGVFSSLHQQVPDVRGMDAVDVLLPGRVDGGEHNRVREPQDPYEVIQK